MMTIANPTQQYWQHYQTIKSTLPGQQQPWLIQQRQTAMDFFMHHGFPDRHVEAWKYTSVFTFSQQQFALPKAAATITQQALANLAVKGMRYPLVFVDGFFQASLSTLPSANTPIIISHLPKVLQQQPDLLQLYLTAHASDQAHAFSALNTALMQDGYCIYLPDNTQLSEPLYALFINTQPKAAHTMRNLLVCGKHCQVSVIEDYVSTQEQPYFTNTVTEIACGESSQVSHYKYQRENDQAFHIGSLTVDQAKDSQVYAYSLALGSRLSRSDSDIRLKHTGGYCRLLGLYVTHDKQHCDHHTAIHHAAGHCRSYQYYKGIVDDKSRAVFNGRVVVDKNAQRTDAEQQNRNLLLSKQAEIDTKPELEIYADDVKCSHGATVGQLDEKALFYLRSRGIPLACAQQLLIHAFSRDIIQQIPLASLRQALVEQLVEKLS